MITFRIIGSPPFGRRDHLFLSKTIQRVTGPAGRELPEPSGSAPSIQAHFVCDFYHNYTLFYEKVNDFGRFDVFLPDYCRS